MAGRSSREIVVSEEERSELERRAACYSRPHREVHGRRLGPEGRRVKKLADGRLVYVTAP
jgi:hypothetical protein